MSSPIIDLMVDTYDGTILDVTRIIAISVSSHDLKVS